MRASTSIWSRYVNRLFGRTDTRNRVRRSSLRRREYVPVYAAAEVLEERSLLSATLGAALSIGNGTGASTALDVATDAAGNSFVTGTFTGTVDFDQAATHAGDTDILTARGSQDAFVAKYAADNSLLWVQRMGGDANDVGSQIKIDGSGSVYVAGNFRGSADFGSTTLSNLGDSDGFVEKLDAGGTVQWARSWGTTATDGAQGIAVDSAGNVFALGSHSLTTSAYDYDILKFSSTGSPVWSRSLDTNTLFSSGGLTVDAPGNVYVAGSFQGTVDFDPSSKTYNVYGGTLASGFVLKLNTDAKFGWVSPFVGQSAYSQANNVALDGSGNVIVAGSYSGPVDFNPGSGITTLPNHGGFITKLNSSGGLAWARALETSSGTTTLVNGLDVDGGGAIYATGSFNGAVDLNPGSGVDSHTTAGGNDIFVLKLTAAGNYSWANTFGGTGEDVGSGIAVDPTGGIHLVGWYTGTVDFDPDPVTAYNLTTPGTFKNGFRLRLRQV